MKKYSILLISFLFLFTLASCNATKKGTSTSNSTSSSQPANTMSKSDLLVGNWKFADVHGKENMDETGLKMLTAFFGSLGFNFAKGGSYTAVIMDKDDTGNWKLNANEDTIQMNSTKSQESMDISIIELSQSKLIIQFEKAAFVLKRM